MIFLETERLVLREVEEGDFEAYFRADLSDREMDRMMLRDPCDTEEALRRGFEWFLYHEERAYVLVQRQSGRVIGNLTVYERVPELVAAHERVRGKRGKALSFALLPEFRGQGFMHEAVRAVIGKLFLEENADYVNCGYLSYNAPSKALQEKLGFSYLLTERFSVDGEERCSVENILWRE